LKEEYRVVILENRVLRRICRSKRSEVIGELEKIA
jgi:hypothetical protein